MPKIINPAKEVQQITLPKNASERIHMALREYEGHEFLDIRVHYRDDSGDWQPTRKGIAVSPSRWPAFYAAVQEMDAQLRAVGLVEEIEDDDDEGGMGA